MISLLLLLKFLYFQDRDQLTRGARLVYSSQPRYLALMIGINEYHNAAFIDLQTPVADITRLAELLERRFGFQDTVTLTNQQATEGGIRTALNRLVRDEGPEDNILIYYAGHGIRGEVLTGFWVPHDGVEGTTDRYISNSDILSYLDGCLARHILVISDACFSGSIFIRSIPGADPLDYQAQYQRKSKWALTSGNLTPVVDTGPSKDHSVFAYHLIRILSQSQQPFLTPKQITGEIGSAVFHHSDRMQLPRCGRLAGDKGGSFVFWNREAVAPDGGPYKPPWESPESESFINLKQEMRNRRVWVVGDADESLCERLEDLGMIVDCQPNWQGRSRSRQEIVTYCSQITEEAISALRTHLGLTYYKIRTHGGDPQMFRNEDCGRSYEITIRN